MVVVKRLIVLKLLNRHNRSDWILICTGALWTHRSYGRYLLDMKHVITNFGGGKMATEVTI